MGKTKVGIINVTGYAGVELARLLGRHPGVELVSVTGRSAAGQRLADVFPHLADIDLPVTPSLGDVEVAFSAMPHKESVTEIIPLVERGIRVVDISADFRLKNAADYPPYYGFEHPAPSLLEGAVYGLPELYRSAISGAQIVANPGCYPTGAILALAPAAKADLITTDIIVDSKSGVSGAGRSLSLTTHYPEANEDVSAYALGGHRHLSEILQEVGLLAAGSPALTFVPHLMPMTRGILTTAYAPLVGGKIPATEKGKEEILSIYSDYYRDEPFIRVLPAPVHTKYAQGSNYCFIHPTLDLRTGRLIVTSAIDNLVKGAAGQAVQNMNIMLGLAETTGLEQLPLYP
ncbi:N-acetyl-gamma-glutamyl-phosphate reductase [Chloroflexota bacterium]